jgi:hypothetical protein
MVHHSVAHQSLQVGELHWKGGANTVPEIDSTRFRRKHEQMRHAPRGLPRDKR